MDSDFALAVQIQEQLNKDGKDLVSIYETKETATSSRPLSIIDPQWELTDPIPDIRALLLQFDSRFFWSGLYAVTVSWSPRMYSCAGVCVYEGRGGLCSIRLSGPLLKLRPRKDLVETLLHEMIHAYLFITDNNKDHDGHGAEFHKHMHRINKDTGTNITVYHNFHDEVDEYRQHWWRCDGCCRETKPHYGYVKRAMNRAPSARDFWWDSHKRKCGGVFVKVKEPETYGKKKRKTTDNKATKIKTPTTPKTKPNADIRSYSGGGGNIPGSSTRSTPVNNRGDRIPISSVAKDTNKTGIYAKKTASGAISVIKSTGSVSRTSTVTIPKPRTNPSNVTKQDGAGHPVADVEKKFPGTGFVLGGQTKGGGNKYKVDVFQTLESPNSSNSTVKRTKKRPNVNENDSSTPKTLKQRKIDIFFEKTPPENVSANLNNVKSRARSDCATPLPTNTGGRGGNQVLLEYDPIINNDVVIIPDSPVTSVSGIQHHNIPITSTERFAQKNHSSSGTGRAESRIDLSLESHTSQPDISQKCPVCSNDVKATEINIHLDLCLFIHSDT